MKNQLEPGDECLAGKTWNLFRFATLRMSYADFENCHRSAIFRARSISAGLFGFREMEMPF